MPPALEVQGLNHWTAREVPQFIVHKKTYYANSEVRVR